MTAPTLTAFRMTPPSGALGYHPLHQYVRVILNASAVLPPLNMGDRHDQIELDHV